MAGASGGDLSQIANAVADGNGPTESEIEVCQTVAGAAISCSLRRGQIDPTTSTMVAPSTARTSSTVSPSSLKCFTNPNIDDGVSILRLTSPASNVRSCGAVTRSRHI